MSESVRFCATCGAQRTSGASRFCVQCGGAFEPTAGGAALAAAPSFAGLRQRPEWIVRALGLVGSFAYGFWWMWMSWRELKRVTGDASMRPFWHAFAAFFVPVYGIFRVHAHFRAIDDLCAGARVTARVGPGLATLVFSLVLCVLYSGWAMSVAYGSVGRRADLAPLSLFLVGIAVAYVVGWGQHALNAAYSAMAVAAERRRPHALEIVFLAVFGLAFLASLFGSATQGGVTSP